MLLFLFLLLLLLLLLLLFFFSETQNALLVLANTDIHAVAGLLKLYFRDLPQSLFTSKLYRKFVEGLSKYFSCGYLKGIKFRVY